MRALLLSRLVLAGFTICIGLPALLAWGTPGHMATGSVAFRTLQAQPGGEAVIRAAAAILEKHPFVTGAWAAQLAQADPGTVSRAERLFMLAAQWPDEVRSGTLPGKYHHADWHYVNLQYTSGKKTPGPVIAGKLLEQLDANLRIVQDPAATDADRAIALCWVFHQMGDLHQPLHVTALVSKKYAKGDRGGNESYVIPVAGRAPNNLHSLWDGYGVKRDDDFAGAQDNAVRLIAAHPRAGLSELGSEWLALERSTVLFRDPTNKGRRFVPLLLADCKLPDTLRRSKVVDFREESEVWTAEDPDLMIHFNGERFLGSYPDVMPTNE